jgi:hypothetical protein
MRLQASCRSRLPRNPVSSSPATLAYYAHASVHAFLSAAHFLPGVREFAVKEGVTPVLECCSVVQRAS